MPLLERLHLFEDNPTVFISEEIQLQAISLPRLRYLLTDIATILDLITVSPECALSITINGSFNFNNYSANAVNQATDRFVLDHTRNGNAHLMILARSRNFAIGNERSRYSDGVYSPFQTHDEVQLYHTNRTTPPRQHSGSLF